MSIKNDVVDFLRTYANLTGSEFGESEDLVRLELSPVEKRKHLLSMLKFSFSKEVCERENAELLTVTNKAYQNILSEAKQAGIVVVARSFQAQEPLLMLNYLVNMKCQNRTKEELRSITFRLSDYSTTEPLTYWSEIDPTEAATIGLEADLLSGKIREEIMDDISDLMFRFEDEVERKMDRERSMMQKFYEQLRKEREGAAAALEEQIVDLTKKMHSTNSMKVYNSAKKKIEGLKRKITELEGSKSKDIDKINREHEKAFNRIKVNYMTETNIDLLNGLIILPADPSDY